MWVAGVVGVNAGVDDVVVVLVHLFVLVNCLSLIVLSL